jgi:hypothetical protein
MFFDIGVCIPAVSIGSEGVSVNTHSDAFNVLEGIEEVALLVVDGSATLLLDDDTPAAGGLLKKDMRLFCFILLALTPSFAGVF